MKLLKLKNVKFEYCGKTYTQERYISEDRKYLFTYDDLDYVSVYRANKDGKGAQITDLLCHEFNKHRYPIYSIKKAIERLEKELDNENYQIKTGYTFNIHLSHFERICTKKK